MGAEADDAKSANLRGGFAAKLGSVGFGLVAMRERLRAAALHLPMNWGFAVCLLILWRYRVVPVILSEFHGPGMASAAVNGPNAGKMPFLRTKIAQNTQTSQHLI